MSSITYLREQFSKLQAEEEREAFCRNIVNTEYWCRSEEQMDLLPERFLEDFLNNLQSALRAEGRIDLYDITPACMIITKCSSQSPRNKPICRINYCEAYMPG